MYNEADQIGHFVKACQDTLIQVGEQFEIVLVNDASKDDTLEVLRELCSTIKELRVINLYENVGQHIATSIGLKECQGQHIFMMDSDMQVHPKQMLALWEVQKSNPRFDIYSSFRKQRSKNSIRKIGSWAISILLRLVTRSKLKDIGSTFKLIRRSALDHMLSRGVLIQNLPILMMHLNFRVYEHEIDYGVDQERRSHYRFTDLGAAIILAILNFTTGLTTLFLLIATGAGIFVVSSLLIAYLIIDGMIHQSPLPTNYLIFFLMLFLIGLLFILLGIISFKLERINKNLHFRQSMKQQFDIIHGSESV